MTVDAADIVLVRSELSDLLSFLALSKVARVGSSASPVWVWRPLRTGVDGVLSSTGRRARCTPIVSDEHAYAPDSTVMFRFVFPAGVPE